MQSLYKFLGLVLFFTLLTGIYAQQPTSCAVSAAPTIVHSEGVAERVGDIILQCSGTPGASVTASLNISLPVAITNRINASGYSIDATLSIDSKTGSIPSGVLGMVTNQSISFSGFSFTFPASGTISLVVDDIRANVNQLGVEQSAPIMAYLGSSLALQNSAVTVGSAQVGLLATSMDSAVTCTGSPTPSSVSLSNLMAAKTSEQSTRVTEGFPSSFQPKDPTSDTGTRFLLTFAGIPSGAAIYVPDAVAGSGATVPTAGGDFGTAAAVGEYTPGSHTLLLVRVLNADNMGAGGTLTALPAASGSGALVLNGANPVTLTSGAGYAVYEVVDANSSATETAQIPTYFAIPSNSGASTSTGGVSLAPVSTVGTASTTAPIPRFAAVAPPSDCTALGDCNATYYPRLQVTSTNLQATTVAGGKKIAVGNIIIKDTRGGTLDWTASATYTNGSGWLSFTEPFGADNAEIQVIADPSELTAGTYQATVTINGGSIAGSQSIPLTLTVTPAVVAATVMVTGVTDAADFHAGPVAPGSLAAVWGSNMAGQNVSVTFNGTAAKLLYSGAGQINLEIPAGLSGQTSAQMVVTADSASSAAFSVQLTAVAPAVFTPGVLNQDNTVNSATNPAAVGSVLQIFGTGMPDSGATVTVTLQNRGNLIPLYAGAAPGLLGVEQVNVAIPADLQGVTSNLTICVADAQNQQHCSQPEPIALKP